MANATVSAIMPAELKERGNLIIKEHGSNPNQVIRRIWEQIVATGELPDEETDMHAQSEAERRRQAFEESKKLIFALPKDAPLNTMSPAELKEELMNRDI